MLTGDVSAAENLNEAKVDKCIKLVLELRNLKITIDLHKHNYERPGKYNAF